VKFFDFLVLGTAKVPQILWKLTYTVNAIEGIESESLLSFSFFVSVLYFVSMGSSAM
jgi:hypothetical protein